MDSTKKTAILFVCMGNICRSPTAEGVFRAQAIAAGLEHGLHIDSAGTHAYHVGAEPDARSQQYALKRGIDLSAQRARQVRASDFAEFDYVLAMDKANLALLRAACPEQYQHKLALFLDFAYHTDAEEVPDPYYGGATGFDLVLDYIEDASAGLLDVLQP